MKPLVSAIWQVVLDWLYSWLSSTPVQSANLPSVSQAETREQGAAATQARVAEAEQAAPRTEEELSARLREGSF